MLINLAGRRLYYTLEGPENGQVVCFTHSLASDGGMWAEQVPPLLAAGYRVLRLDMRGHGGSDPVAGDYTMEQLADDTAAVVEATGVGPVHYIGLSIGGMIGQALAFRHAAKLKSLMLCDTRARALGDQAPLWAERIGMARQAGSVEPLVETSLQRWFSPAFMQSHRPRVDKVRATMRACSLDGYIGCGLAISSFDFTPRLGSIALPTLVLVGDQDPSTTPEENKYLAAHVKGARLEVIPGLHLPNIESAGRFNAIMMEWLKQH